jgi:hypothetical protein
LPVETPSFFAQVIQDHLELKRQNSSLESDMPIDRYKNEDPFGNHPLFKSEEQARIEDTMSGNEPMSEEPMSEEPAPVVETKTLKWPGEDEAEQATSESQDPRIDDSLWNQSRDFDWGD